MKPTNINLATSRYFQATGNEGWSSVCVTCTARWCNTVIRTTCCPLSERRNIPRPVSLRSLKISPPNLTKIITSEGHVKSGCNRFKWEGSASGWNIRKIFFHFVSRQVRTISASNRKCLRLRLHLNIFRRSKHPYFFYWMPKFHADH